MRSQQRAVPHEGDIVARQVAPVPLRGIEVRPDAVPVCLNPVPGPGMGLSLQTKASDYARGQACGTAQRHHGPCAPEVVGPCEDRARVAVAAPCRAL